MLSDIKQKKKKKKRLPNWLESDIDYSQESDGWISN